MTGSGCFWTPAAGWMIATGSSAFGPSPRDRSTATVSTPHSTRGSAGTSSLHGPATKVGVNGGAVAAGGALDDAEEAAPCGFASDEHALTSSVASATAPQRVTPRTLRSAPGW